MATMLLGGRTVMYEFGEIWQYVPEDEASEPDAPPCAEEAAVQVGAPVEWGRPIDDAGRREVTTADEDDVVLRVADDEDDGRAHRDTERELDVGELLERQHHSFAPPGREAAW
jgi:hypothetical protein